MTKETAIEILTRITNNNFYGGEVQTACRMGIEALSTPSLTWEDVAKIITIYEAGIDNGDYRRYNEAEWMKKYSQDILKRFNERREKK